MIIKKYFLWFYMFAKRLILRWSFVVILCLIPLLIWGANAAMKGESGILTIYLCADENNSAANDVIDNIQNGKSSILFKRSCSIDESLKALEQKKADAVWYFEDDFSEKLDKYASGKTKKPVVKVFEREDTIPLRLSRERLYGGIFGKFAYSVYRNFVYSEYFTEDEVPEEIIKKYPGQRGGDKELVVMETLGESSAQTDSKAYLVMPIRGLLALLTVLCGFASVMVFLGDKKSGKFDWLTPRKQILPGFAQCLAGVILSAVAVFVALFVSGIWTTFLKETVSMILFVLAVTGFCLNLCMIFKSPSKFGALIPAFIIVMLALSPIFFDINILNGVKCILPTHYYLYSLYDPSYIKGFLCYIPCVYISAWVICRIRTARF